MSPSAVSGLNPMRAPVTETSTPPIRIGSACRARVSARSSMRARSIVGQKVTRVPVTVRPSQPSAIISRVRDDQPGVPRVCGLSGEQDAEGGTHRHARGRGEVVADGDAEASREGGPEPAPELQAVPHHRPGCAGRAGRVSHHQPAGTPTKTSVEPVSSSASRRPCCRRLSSVAGVLSSACAKWVLHTMTACVTAPRTTRCRTSQSAAGRPRPTAATTRAAVSQSVVGWSRSGHAPRPGRAEAAGRSTWRVLTRVAHSWLTGAHSGSRVARPWLRGGHDWSVTVRRGPALRQPRRVRRRVQASGPRTR